MKPRRILVLGAGRVSRPLVRYFLGQDDCRLTLATLVQADAAALLDGHPHGSAREIDVTDPAQPEALIRDSDVVISLLPYRFHVGIARSAIRSLV